MSGKPAAFVTAATLAAVLLWYYQKQSGDSFDNEPSIDNGDYTMDDVETNSTLSADPVAAFLWAIRYSENAASDVDSGADYGVFYGGSRFIDFSNHPALTGEKKGVPLSDAMCAASGFGPGCVSTAAGAYQITVPTWRDVQTWGGALPDFSPASQDEAARRILDHDGITSLLQGGDVVGAISLASRRWASMPGSNAKQGGKSLSYVLDRYNAALAAQGA